MTGMPRPRPPHLIRETTRHGTTVWYVRRGKGPRIRLREPYGTRAFFREYEAAVAGRTLDAAARKAETVGTLGWLIGKYMESPAWTQNLSVATRGQRSGLLRETVKAAGNERADAINTQSIRAAMDRRAHQPHGANNWLKTMRGLFAWAIERELVPADPTRGVKLLAGENDRNGYHTWTEDEVARFEARYPVGTRERLALDVLLYTGLRRGDAARLGRPHVRNGVIRVRTEKTDQEVTIPVLPPLAASIAAAPIGDLTFIATEKGRPYTKESFGNWFRDVCAEMGLPGRAHGLRKAGACRAAEYGATNEQLNAWFGWAPGSRESAIYTRRADRAKMASALADKLSAIPAPTDPVRGATEGEKSLMAPRAVQPQKRG